MQQGGDGAALEHVYPAALCSSERSKRCLSGLEAGFYGGLRWRRQHNFPGGSISAQSLLCFAVLFLPRDELICSGGEVLKLPMPQATCPCVSCRKGRAHKAVRLLWRWRAACLPAWVVVWPPEREIAGVKHLLMQSFQSIAPVWSWAVPAACSAPTVPGFPSQGWSQALAVLLLWLLCALAWWVSSSY